MEGFYKDYAPIPTPKFNIKTLSDESSIVRDRDPPKFTKLRLLSKIKSQNAFDKNLAKDIPHDKLQIDPFSNGFGYSKYGQYN